MENTFHIEEAFLGANKNIVYSSYNEEYAFQTVKSQNYKKISGVIPKLSKGKHLPLRIKIHGLGIVESINLVEYFSSFSIINSSAQFQSFAIKILSALFCITKGSAFWKKKHTPIERANYHNNQKFRSLNLLIRN